MENDWSKRMNMEKGFTSFNPSESFVIHCRWVVLNRKTANEMISALNRCANATFRDAPPVVCYFFRISNDQELATDIKNKTKTIGQHPHYSKLYKMLDMNMGLDFIIAKCKREEIDPMPFLRNISRDELMELHESELQFDPVVIDLTEFYLDNRSFVSHASSKDYMDSYSVLMQPHRSIQPFTVVLGTPTLRIYEGVLEPMLKARKRLENRAERLNLNLKMNDDDSSSQQLCAYVLFDVNIEQKESLSFDTEKDFDICVTKELNEITNILKPTFDLAVLNEAKTTYRVILACDLIVLLNDIIVKNQALFGALGECLTGAVYIFNTSHYNSNNNNNDNQTNGMNVSYFESMQTYFTKLGIDVVLADVDNTTGATSTAATLAYGVRSWAGHGRHNKYRELTADTTVLCKELA